MNQKHIFKSFAYLSVFSAFAGFFIDYCLYPKIELKEERFRGVLDNRGVKYVKVSVKNGFFCEEKEKGIMAIFDGKRAFVFEDDGKTGKLEKITLKDEDFDYLIKIHKDDLESEEAKKLYLVFEDIYLENITQITNKDYREQKERISRENKQNKNQEIKQMIL